MDNCIVKANKVKCDIFVKLSLGKWSSYESIFKVPTHLIVIKECFYFDLMQNIIFQFVGQIRAEWIILADDQECQLMWGW